MKDKVDGKGVSMRHSQRTVDRISYIERVLVVY